MKNIYRFLILILAVIAIPALAAKSPTPLQLFITSVYVDFDTEQIFIRGENFDNRDDPVVTLAGEEQILIEYDDNEIVVELPYELEDGDYLLTVSTGPAVKDYDAYNLTIGAVGPQGEKGDKG